jgi:hypothetical protein
MQNNESKDSKIKQIPDIDCSILKAKVVGFDDEAFIKVRTFLNSKTSERSEPYFIFFHPGLVKISKEINIEAKRIFKTLNFLSSYWPDIVKMKAIFEEESEVYILKTDDLDELASTKKFYHPRNPDIILENADKLIRHAFVLGYSK